MSVYTVPIDKDFTDEEVIAEAKKTQQAISELRKENQELKRKLAGDGDDPNDDEGEVFIVEVD